MKWLVVILVVILHSVVLWRLPVKRWTRRTADTTGVLTMLPFMFAVAWFGSGPATAWVLFPGYYLWKVTKLRGLPPGKGFDWLSFGVVLFAIAFIAFSYYARPQ